MAKKNDSMKHPKGDKMIYLAFCESCGVPRSIGMREINISFVKLKRKSFVCQCNHSTKFPQYILDLIVELKDYL